MTAKKPIVERLLNASRGYTEWRVQGKDGSYCITFDRSDCLDPEREARRWLNNHRKEYPEHKFSGYEVNAVTVYTQDDELKIEATLELKRMQGQHQVFARWMAEALLTLGTIDTDDIEDGGEHLRMLIDRGRRLVNAVLIPPTEGDKVDIGL